jgi:hypothetical protein
MNFSIKRVGNVWSIRRNGVDLNQAGDRYAAMDWCSDFCERHGLESRLNWRGQPNGAYLASTYAL